MHDQGCTDGNCKLRLHPVTGQHTNGGCNCLRDIPTKKRLEVERKIAYVTEWKNRFMDTSAMQRELNEALGKKIEALTARNAELVEACKLADIQYLGCGGNQKPAEVVAAMREILQAALAAEGE